MERIFSGGKGKTGQEGSPFSFLTLSPANEPAKVKHCLGVHTYFQQKEMASRCNAEVTKQEIQLYRSTGPLGQALGVRMRTEWPRNDEQKKQFGNIRYLSSLQFLFFSLEVV